MLSTLKKINFLITKRQRKGLIILSLLLFVGMILEVFGLGVLMPALSIILNPEIIENTPIIHPIRNYFSEFSDQGFTFLFLGAIIIVYFIKSLFIVFLTHKKNRFLTNISASISNKLFSSYLSQPYNFHLNRNSSELIKNIQVEINYFYTFLVSLLTILIEGGFVLSVILTLIYIEPFGAICIGIFYGSLSILFLFFTKSKLSEWGNLRKELDRQVSKITLEGLGGIKELLILGKATFFIEQFSKNNNLKARLGSNRATVSQIPRFYLELISIVGLVSFIILLLLKGRDSASLITTLGVFVAATFRMIPSLNRIIASNQSMKFYLPSVDVIFNEVKSSYHVNESNSFQKASGFKNNIQFEKVSFNYEGQSPVLLDINLSINMGQFIGIIGESGSGKSTLIDLLVGLNKPTSGNILIDGKKNFQLNQAWKKNIGYVPQSIYLLDASIKENIAFGISEKEIDIDRIYQVVKEVKLEQMIKNLKLGINANVGERGVQLSGGQRQRIGLARALYNDPDILILDEATSALDSETERRVFQSVYAFKGIKTIIMITHRLRSIKKCDDVYEIKNKKINKIFYK